MVAIVLPLIPFHYPVEIPGPARAASVSTGALPDIADPLQVPAVTGFDRSICQMIFLLTYISGCVILVTKVLIQVITLLKIIHKADKTNIKGAKLISTRTLTGSFSFINYVFINPLSGGSDFEEIMNHELVHIRQKHWFDLLLAEIICLIQWINPFVWLYSRFIRFNHEYIADEVALRNSASPVNYKTTLLNQMFNTKVIRLADSFNYSLHKNRFDMMEKIVVSPYRKLKVLFILPLFVIIIYAFAEPEYHYFETQPDDHITIFRSPEITGKKVSIYSTGSKQPVKTEIADSVPFQQDTRTNYSNDRLIFLKDTNDPFELEPQYPGGEEELFKFVRKNIRYTEEARSNRVQGRTIVRFLINTEGRTGDFSVLKETDPFMDAEAVRVISLLPEFKPGSSGGKPVNVWCFAPVMFTLPESESVFQITSDQQILKFLTMNIVYPREAKNASDTGRIFVTVKLQKGGIDRECMAFNEKEDISLPFLPQVVIVGYMKEPIPGLIGRSDQVIKDHSSLKSECLRVAELLTVNEIPEWKEKDIGFALQFKFVLK